MCFSGDSYDPLFGSVGRWGQQTVMRPRQELDFVAENSGVLLNSDFNEMLRNSHFDYSM